MLREQVSIAVISGLMMMTAAQAATITNIEGAVSVSQGGAFLPVADGATLSPGTRIKTGAGSAATVAYDNGCTGRVGPSSMMVVPSYPPACSGGGLKDGVVAEETAFSSPVYGGLVVAAGAGIAAAIASTSSSSTLSP